MKRTPALDFVYDDTAERADRLERMLAEMERDG
jgi:ribosome-binding factor A